MAKGLAALIVITITHKLIIVKSINSLTIIIIYDMVISMMTNMSIQFTIGDLLKRYEISPYRLSKEADINFNTMYNMVNNKSTRVDLGTLNSILTSLCNLTGETFKVSDVLDFSSKGGETN